jgi:hypothetical protein
MLIEERFEFRGTHVMVKQTYMDGSHNMTTLSEAWKCCKCDESRIEERSADYYHCYACLRIYYAEYRAKHREELNAYHRMLRKRDAEKYKGYSAKRRQEKLGSMTPEQLVEFHQMEADKTRRLNRVIKDEVFERYGGYICACCGETEEAFLTIDHMDNNGHQHRKEMSSNGHTVGSTQTYRWLKRHGFPPGFQVLCMNCQFGRKHNNGVCPHQERATAIPGGGVGSSGPKRSGSHQGS